jgi:Xaa-Pro aminopeptidase
MWPSDPPSDRLSQIISDLRLIKDSYEIAVIQRAVDATIIGFDSVASIIRSGEARSERDIEVAFNAEARRYGNAVGYETIVGSGSNATTLHWTRNSGGLRDGTLVLLDAGVEDNEFYTADITRTMPVGGKFMGVQQEVYEIVLSAQEAAIASMGPGASFSDAHESAMDVLASGLISLGILKCSPAEAVDPANQYFRRYALHSTSHMLGIDCHDCSTASLDRYADGQLEAGHVLTAEPGLYFQPNDLTVPAELRGLGIRIEDDVLITGDGATVLSAALPKVPSQIEAWLAP